VENTKKCLKPPTRYAFIIFNQRLGIQSTTMSKNWITAQIGRNQNRSFFSESADCDNHWTNWIIKPCGFPEHGWLENPSS
jgi:hypothetical protein